MIGKEDDIVKTERGILVCPKCLQPYKSKGTVMNFLGAFSTDFTCAHCNYSGPGPIKLVKED